MEPTRSRVGVADAAPVALQVELVQPLVFLLLVLDVLRYRRFVPT